MIFGNSEAAKLPAALARAACHGERRRRESTTASAAWEASQLAQRGRAEGVERLAGLPAS